MKGRWSAGLLALALLPAAAEAQFGPAPRTQVERGPVRGEAGVTLALAVPIGEFGDYVNAGGGFSAYGVLYVDDTQTIGLRLGGSWVVYGTHTIRVPLSPTVPFVNVDVTTNNWIASMGFGPQLVLGQGTVRPYLHGEVGFSYFATTTSVEGTHDAEPFASSTNFDDFTYALAGGGGMRIMLSQNRQHPIALDLGTSFVRHGLTEYLREDGLRETPGGGVEIRPIRSRTNLALITLGVSFGLR